jgi:VanZ family protein
MSSIFSTMPGEVGTQTASLPGMPTVGSYGFCGLAACWEASETVNKTESATDVDEVMARYYRDARPIIRCTAFDRLVRISTPLKPAAIVAAFIAYGSLYPFEFVAPENAGDLLRTFFDDHRVWTSRADVLGNIGLFVPFGLAGVWWAEGRMARIRAAAGTLAIGVLLAFGLQVVQIWVVSRSAVLADVLWNSVGILIGVSGGLVFGARRGARRVTMEPVQTAALALIALWFLSELAPLVPSLDFAGLKRSLRPLLVTPRFDPIMAIYCTAEVLVVGRLIMAAAGPRVAPALTGAAIVAVLVGKLVIVDQSVDWTFVAGCAAGFGLALLTGRVRHRATVVAALVFVVAAYTLQSLAPFTIRPPQPFAWFPFASVLDGSMLTNLRAISAVGFVLGGAVWLMRDLGWQPLPAGAGLAVWVLALEIAQMWIVGRTPSSTEPLIGLIAAWALSQMPETADSQALRNHRRR